MKEKNKDKIRVSVWLSEAENEKLKLSAKLCGLSESEFVRQLCKDKTPKPQPTKEFWEMLDRLTEGRCEALRQELKAFSASL